MRVFAILSVKRQLNIKISTYVESNLNTVFSGFDRKLFEMLKPPFLKMVINRFDGCKKDDIVHIILKSFLFKLEWVSKVTDFSETENRIHFTDVGIKLPFFLRSWKHMHGIAKKNNGSIITDDIIYNSPNLLIDVLIYPVLYFQFYSRKKIYKKYFRRKL